MTTLTFDQQLNRTIKVVREMANGKVFPLKDGSRIGMGEDMSIGYVLQHEGYTTIGGLSTMSLKDLNQILEDNDIQFII